MRTDDNICSERNSSNTNNNNNTSIQKKTKAPHTESSRSTSVGGLKMDRTQNSLASTRTFGTRPTEQKTGSNSHSAIEKAS